MVAMEVGDDFFRPLPIVPEPPRERPRSLRAPDALVYRSTNGTEIEIAPDLGRRLECFARASAPDEWIGLLVGEHCADEAGVYVRVMGIVPDEDADRGPGSVATTIASEIRVRERARAFYPDAEPVGWVHSHVACGTVFSSVDAATQRTWSKPLAIGVVVDPWSDETLGVYLGPESERLTRVGPRPTHAGRVRPKPRAVGRDRSARVLAMVALLFALLDAGALVLFASRYRYLAQAAHPQRAPSSRSAVTVNMPARVGR